MFGKIHLLILCSLIGFSWQISSVQAKPMIFCAESENFPPFVMGKEETPKNNPGILVEIAFMAAKQIQFEPKLIRRPWNRCIKNLINGEVDGILAAIYLPEREGWGHFPKLENNNISTNHRVWHVKYPVFQLKSREPIWNGTTFSYIKRSIGTPLGYATAQILENMSLPYSTIPDPTNGLRLVSEGKLDGYILEESIGHRLVYDNKLENLLALEEAFLEADLYIPLSNHFHLKNPKTSNVFWENVAQSREMIAQRLQKLNN